MPFLFYKSRLIMDVKIENIDALNAVLRVKISNEDYNGSYESSLKNYKKQVQLPGFRKGHIPTSVIKKKYGPSILAEEIDKILSQSIQKHITENEINILGNPLPKSDENLTIDWKNPGDFEFEYEIGIAPDFELKLPGRDKHTFHKVKVDDKLIDKQIEDFAKRYGKLGVVDQSTEKDMILASFKELDKDGNLVDEGFNQSSTVSVEFVDDKKAKKKLIGLKSGDELVVDPRTISKGEADMAAMLGIDKERAALYDRNVQLTVTEVKRLSPANLDNALFDKVFGEGKVADLEAFRKRVSEDLEKMFVGDSDRIFKKHVSDTLIKKLKLNLPNEFLKKWILATNKEATKDQLEKEYDQYAKSLKWQLIENRIIKDNDIKVDSDEVVSKTKEMLASQYSQYGMMIPAEEELTKAAQNVLSNQEESRKIFDMMYDQKVLLFLKENLKISEKQVSYDDFVKLASQM
jgi:trigger factor